MTGKIANMLVKRSVDIYYEQETRFREKVVRMIRGKAAQFKPFWIGNEKLLPRVGIFLAKKWVDKLIHMSRDKDRLIGIRHKELTFW